MIHAMRGEGGGAAGGRARGRGGRWWSYAHIDGAMLSEVPASMLIISWRYTIFRSTDGVKTSGVFDGAMFICDSSVRRLSENAYLQYHDVTRPDLISDLR